MVPSASNLAQAPRLSTQETPLLLPSAAYLSGWFLSHFVLALEILIWGSLFLALSAVAFCKKNESLKILFAFSMLLFGLLNGQWEQQKKEVAIVQFNQEWKAIRGIVDSEPQIQKHQNRKKWAFVLKNVCVESNMELCKKLPGKLRVVLLNPVIKPVYGQSIRVWGKLNSVVPPKNPGEFDYRSYLQRRDIHWQILGMGPHSIRAGEVNQNLFAQTLRFLHRLRFQISVVIEKIYDAKFVPYIQALLIGMNTQVPLEQKEAFMKTGTAHLLAISGMNMTLIAGTCYALLLYCGMSRKKSACAGIVLTCIYVFIGGAAIPLQRAGWMSAAIFFAICLQRKHYILNILMAAFLLIALSVPSSLNEISFQLSFLGVMGMIMASRGGLSWPEAPSFLSHSISLSLWTTPALIYHFQIFSFSSLPANLFAIPVFHLVTLSSWFSIFFSPIPFIGAGFVSMAEGLLAFALSGIEKLAFIPGGYFYFPKPHENFLATYYLLLGTLSWRIPNSQIKKKILGLGGLFLIFIVMEFCLWHWESKQPRVLFFSVKQQDVFFISVKNKKWLINSGLNYPSQTPQKIIEPFLKLKGITRLNGLIMTSEKQKSWGGAQTLDRNFQIERWYLPPGVSIAKRKGWKPERRKIVNPENIDLGTDVTLMWLDSKPAERNFSIEFKDTSLLFLFDPTPLRKVSNLQQRMHQAKILYLSESFWQQIKPSEWETVIQQMKPEKIITSQTPPWFNRLLVPITLHNLSVQGALEVLEK